VGNCCCDEHNGVPHIHMDENGVVKAPCPPPAPQPSPVTEEEVAAWRKLEADARGWRDGTGTTPLGIIVDRAIAALDAARARGSK